MRYLLITSLLLGTVSCASEGETRGVAASTNDSGIQTQTEDLTKKDVSSMSTTASGFYALGASTLEGTPIDLSDYAGQVTLVVNVASECGYTRQYAGLQKLHEELAASGFSVLGFPSNEFGGQEPGSPQEIRDFCTSRFNVTFPMFSKSKVKPGGGQSPLYAFLQEQTGETPNWNFCKYLVGKDGQVIAFYKSGVAPDADELRKAIESALG